MQSTGDTRKRLHVDEILGFKVQIDWFQPSRGDTKYCGLFALLEDEKSTVSWNKQEQITLSQVRGFALMITGILSNCTKLYVKDHNFGKHPTGLGQWCSLLIKGSSGLVCHVTYYIPSCPAKTKTEIVKDSRDSNDAEKVSLSAWTQHTLHFESLGTKDVVQRTKADEDLLNHLCRWRA